MFYFTSSNQRPLSFIACGNLVNDEHFRHIARCLDFFVLLVCVEGILYIEQDDAEHMLNPGEFMLLLPEHRHRGYRSSEGMLSYFWCHFSVPNEYHLLDDFGVSQFLQSMELKGAQRDVYLLPEHGSFVNSNRIALEFRQILDFSRQEMYSSSVINYALSLLVMDLTQEFIHQNDRQPYPGSALSRIADIQDYIRINYASDLSISKLSGIFGYNRNYLSSIFKKVAGHSLVQHINHTRIDIAKALLLNTQDSVVNISYRVGFNDSKYFIRVFRSFEGMTPVTFRNVYTRKYVNRE